MIRASASICIGEPFRLGTNFSQMAHTDLQCAVQSINEQLASNGSHARVKAEYMDSGARLALAVVDSLDY